MKKNKERQLFHAGEQYKLSGSRNAVVVACENKNDVLLKTKDEYIWAVEVSMDMDKNHLVWERNFTFALEDEAIIPSINDLMKYEDYPFMITDGFTYAIDLEKNCAILAGSNFYDDEHSSNQSEIPAKVKFCNQIYPVTEVADWGFYKNQQIVNLRLPESVKRIGSFAFAKSSIKQLDFKPETEVEKQAFYECDQLKIPEVRYDETTMDFEKKFLQSIHDLVGIPMSKLKKYTEEFNNPLNILDHPDVLDLNKKQQEKLNALRSLVSGFNHLKELDQLKTINISSTQKAIGFMSGLIGHHRDCEYFVVAMLSRNNNVIDTIIEKGTLFRVDINPRDILKKVLNHDTQAIILGHNHTTSNCEPSKEDINLTQKFINIFDPLGIGVYDHVIVGDQAAHSMAEYGNIDFNRVWGETDYSQLKIAERQSDYENEYEDEWEDDCCV